MGPPTSPATRISSWGDFNFLPWYLLGDSHFSVASFQAYGESPFSPFHLILLHSVIKYVIPANSPFPIDILLDIFDFYRINDLYSWNYLHGWLTLMHVSRKWRQCILDSPSRLQLTLCLREETPVLDMLTHFPPLPITLDYSFHENASDPEAESGVLAALGYVDRLHSITLDGPDGILHKLALTMDEFIPTLTYLKLSTHSKSLNLPRAFLGGDAPNLRHLCLDGAYLPTLPSLLSSARFLTSLALRVPKNEHHSPGELAECLHALLQLKDLSLNFLAFDPSSLINTESSHSGQQVSEQHFILPQLEQFDYCGESRYLEVLVGGLRMPHLKHLDVRLFPRLTFTTPHLSRLIENSINLVRFSARIIFTSNFAVLHIHPPSDDDESGRRSGMRIIVSHERFDWQVHSMAQICSGLSPVLSDDVRNLIFDHDLDKLPSNWQGEVDPSLWLALLAPFRHVQNMWCSVALVEELGNALAAEVGDGSEADEVAAVVPELSMIITTWHRIRAQSDIPRRAFNRFLTLRRSAARPVLLEHYGGVFRVIHSHPPSSLKR
ncbi:hypothetical protein B0F90DRAFT_1778834 [Multifurca ochricompacta]|uniref:F-box domain-containing protein n=1 Tax=Multifurca ochricompacta TaxID=376703 RepID=A0AAD4LUY4_9AGAM|nr:hypothetical protein B0F90DRAFT_1778834 [Multifurca ochricompacta]